MESGGAGAARPMSIDPSRLPLDRGFDDRVRGEPLASEQLTPAAVRQRFLRPGAWTPELRSDAPPPLEPAEGPKPAAVLVPLVRARRRAERAVDAPVPAFAGPRGADQLSRRAHRAIRPRTGRRGAARSVRGNRTADRADSDTGDSSHLPDGDPVRGDSGGRHDRGSDRFAAPRRRSRRRVRSAVVVPDGPQESPAPGGDDGRRRIAICLHDAVRRRAA